jgi:hypothetical protein
LLEASVGAVGGYAAATFILFKQFPLPPLIASDFVFVLLLAAFRRLHRG